MRKINTLFSENSQFTALNKNVRTYQNLQQLWHAAAPKTLSQASFASSLINGQLTVYADSAIIANKIKLTHTSLLTQLQNLQKKDPLFRECKVTAITVKVQVKSHPIPVIKVQRKLSAHAASSLKILAESLGESPLASKLKILANKP
jgi:hypothetical protein